MKQITDMGELKLAGKGKSIGEVRAFAELQFKNSQTKPMLFL